MLACGTGWGGDGVQAAGLTDKGKVKGRGQTEGPHGAGGSVLGTG